MKYIVLCTIVLFFFICNADSTELVSFQQPAWYTVISNSFDTSSACLLYAQPTAESSHNITISTRSKAYHYHAPTYQQDLHCMNTEQLIQYFACYKYTEDDILQRQDLFLSAEYLAFAKKLPKYAEYVTKHYNEYRKFNWYTKLIGFIFAFYKPGFQDTFTRLYRECEEKQLAQKRHEQKQGKLKEQQQQKADDYCVKIDTVRHDDELVQAIPSNHQQSRHAAYAQIKSATLNTVTRTYAVASDTVTFARDYDITETDLITLQGNAYEHQLHSEFLEQLYEIHTISTYYALKPSNLLIDAVGHSVAIGMEANRLQQPDTATAWANFGWKTLEIIEACGEGLLVTVENSVNMIRYPIHTLKQTVYGLGSIIYWSTHAAGHTMGTAVKLNVLQELEEYDAYASEVQQINNNISAFCSICAEKLVTTPTKDIVKHGTTIVADVFLTHKMFTLGSSLCSRATPFIRDALAHIRTRVPRIQSAIISAIEAARTESPVLQTAEGILMKASENATKVGGAAVEALKSTRVALEAVHAEYMAHLEMELGALRVLFDNKVKGFAEFANKFLKVKYKHILGIEDLAWNHKGALATIDGFHHDAMNVIRKSRLVEFADQTMYEHGFYRATLLYEGNVVKYKGTFFPADWSREKIIEKIYEAYDSFMKSGLKPAPTKDDKYLIKGIIKEGVEIEMRITKNGHVITAYPVLK